MTETQISNATLEAIYWWNRTEGYYHGYFSRFEKIYKNKKLLDFFTTKVFEVFLSEYSVRRNISAGYKNVDIFIDELFENNFFSNVSKGNTLIVDQVSLKIKEHGTSTQRHTRSLLSKIAFLCNPNDFSLNDSLAKQSIWKIVKTSKVCKLSDLESYSNFAKVSEGLMLKNTNLLVQGNFILHDFNHTEAYQYFSQNQQAFARRIFDKYLWLQKQSSDSKNRRISNETYKTFIKF